MAAQAFNRSDADCKEPASVEETLYLNKIRVNHKVVTSYFNLDKYLDEDIHGIPASSFISVVDLSYTQTQSRVLAVQQNAIQVYSDKFVDMSSIPLIGDFFADKAIVYNTNELTSVTYFESSYDWKYGLYVVSMQ